MDSIDLFDKYIKRELSEKERLEFDTRLKDDKSFADEFKVYSATIIGICKEAEQDNKDFEMAMKGLTKAELQSIIKGDNSGRKSGTTTDIDNAEDKDTNKAPAYNSKSASKFRKWLIGQSIGIAALLAIGVFYIVIVRNEAKQGRQEALAMNQEAMNKVDNAIYLSSDYSKEVFTKGAGDEVDISKLNDDELKAMLPELEKQYKDSYDDRDLADNGDLLVMCYVRLHERDKAKALLTQLINKFQNNEDYKDGYVENWKTILNLIQ